MLLAVLAVSISVPVAYAATPEIMSAETVSPRAIKVMFSEPITGATGEESESEWLFRGQNPASVTVPTQSFQVDSTHATLFDPPASGPDYMVTVDGTSATAVVSVILEFDSIISAGSALSYSPASAANLDGTAVSPQSIQVELRSSYSPFLDTAVITAYVAADSSGAPDASFEPAYALDTFARLEGARDVVIYETDGQKLAELFYSDEWKNIEYDPETMMATLSDPVELGPSSSTQINLAGSVGTFAVVASSDDNGLQIINITDPYSPLPVSAMADGLSVAPSCAGRDPPSYCTQSVPAGDQVVRPLDCDQALQALRNPDAFVPLTPGASRNDVLTQAQNDLDSCLENIQEQSLNILRAQLTDTPVGEAPTLVDSLLNFSFVNELEGVRAVDLATINGHTFVVAASYTDDGLQILRITDPRAPVKYGSLDGILGANDLSVFSTGNRHYAIVTSEYGIKTVQERQSSWI